MTTVKITELSDIGANLASSTVIPVVNMAGTPITQKTNVGNIANIILEGAGVDYPEATVALLAQTVSNAAQPNITSVGTLTNVVVSGNANVGILKVSGTSNLGAVGNVTITGGSNGQVLTTDGSNVLSWTTVSGGGNGTPGGNTTEIQFNDAGAFAGNTGFTFNKTTGILAAPFADVSGVANIVGGGATVRVGRLLGPDRMREMMLTGRNYGAEDGLRLGLAHYCVGEGEGLPLAQKLARQISDNAPFSNYLMINTISRINDMSRSDGLFTESLAAAMSQTSDGAKEGLRAFLEKREPKFKGY